jgi:hypothetical protein
VGRLAECDRLLGDDNSSGGGFPRRHDMKAERGRLVDELIMAENSSNVYLAPLSAPSSAAYIAKFDGASLLKSMTLVGSKVYVTDSNNGFGWVNLEGTQCEGLFYENRSGKEVIFNGYLYIEQNATLDINFSRLKLP